MPAEIRKNEEIANERNIKTKLALKSSKGIDRTFEAKWDDHEFSSKFIKSAQWRFCVIQKEDHDQWNWLVFQKLQWTLHRKSPTS